MNIFVMLLALICSLSLLPLVFRLVKKISELEKQLSNLRKEFDEISRDHPALVTADLCFAKQIKEINDQLVSLDAHLQSLQNTRQNDGGYQHALRILEMGGSREEIVNACHLSNAEAELIMNLQAYRAALSKV